MEVEVGEILLELMEIIEIEHLVESTGTIEVVHLTVTAVERAGHVHDLCTQRSHTSTTADPDHFLLRVEMGMEVTVGTTHDNLVAGLECEDVG